MPRMRCFRAELEQPVIFVVRAMCFPELAPGDLILQLHDARVQRRAAKLRKRDDVLAVGSFFGFFGTRGFKP